MNMEPTALSHDALKAQLQTARALVADNQLEQGRAACEVILAQDPRHFDALVLLGVVQSKNQQANAAVEAFCRALEVRPASHAAYYGLGVAMCQLQQFAAGIECFDQALVHQPDYAAALCDRASALGELGRWSEALVGYEQTLALTPQNAEALGFRGNALLALGRVDAAIASLGQSLALGPQAASTHLNLGNAHQAAGDYGQALASYDRALALKPHYLLAYSNRSVALKHLHRLDEALASCEQALALDPGYADAQWNKALTLLLKGDLRAGFAGYQWRWKTAAFAAIDRHFPQPLWLGDVPVAGKTVLLHPEQGLGDTLQFVRYAKAAADLGAHVVLEAEPALLDLFTGLEGVATLVRQGDALPRFDLVCPLLSLPVALGTDLASVPAAVPYLRARAGDQATWSQRLGPKTRLRVGLVWSGSPSHKDDHNRSLALATLMDALPDGAQYVSLQKEVRASDQAALEHAGLAHFGPVIGSFSDTAALCACMDVVISVDTSVAHLSGALARPTWVLLPYLPDWRWLMDRSDSPWYPSARLYRQSTPRDWSAPLAAVRADVLALMA